MGRCVVASLGFDVDFILRRLRDGDVGRLTCYGLKVDDQGWSRVEKAFSLVKHYCEAVKLKCSLESVGPTSLVSEVKSIIERELRDCKSLELFLTGGPRISVVGGLVAALLLPEDLAGRVEVRVEGETFTGVLRFNVGALVRYMTLDEASKSIVKASVEPRKILEIVKMTELPRATVYRKVERLATVKLLEAVGENMYITERSLRELLTM
ncbi:MAG: hypothetical protein P3X22_003660 [Thermoprotei archaeon]|nr:hypothetical protein [Thermoprotei archaeon]